MSTIGKKLIYFGLGLTAASFLVLIAIKSYKGEKVEVEPNAEPPITETPTEYEKDHVVDKMNF